MIVDQLLAVLGKKLCSIHRVELVVPPSESGGGPLDTTLVFRFEGGDERLFVVHGTHAHMERLNSPADLQQVVSHSAMDPLEGDESLDVSAVVDKADFLVTEMAVWLEPRGDGRKDHVLGLLLSDGGSSCICGFTGYHRVDLVAHSVLVEELDTLRTNGIAIIEVRAAAFQRSRRGESRPR